MYRLSAVQAMQPVSLAPRGLRRLLCLFSPALFAITAAAQAVKVTPIGEAIRNRGEYSPVHLGESLTLSGVVTDGSHDVGSGNSLANLQDTSGGIAVFGDQKVLQPGAFQRGDVIEARGKLSQYRGMEELQVEEVHRTGRANVPAPVNVLAAQLNGEEYSGQLVRVQGQMIRGPDGTLALQDRSGEIPVYLIRSFFQNTSFMGRLLKGGQVEVVGLARQRLNDGAPPNSGYLLSPRDEHDFQFGPLPLYREMAAGVVLVVGCFIYLWQRRRAAEKRARALAVLSEGLQESDERFRQMAESINQVFWMFDVSAGRVIYASPAFERIWGRPHDTVAERSKLLETVHPDDRERARAYLENNQTQACDETYRIVRPDGAIQWIHDRSFPVFNRVGELYRVTGIAEDITKHRELEEQLRQSQKMEAVGRLAGGIAHDFNNLLTVIGGYSRMLVDSTSPEDPRHGKLVQILAASSQASSLTAQLLAFGRKQVLQPKVVNINHLLTNMEALLGRVMGEHISLQTALSKDVLRVKADPNQLEQVLINLAGNARDAMPNGGEFRIETALVEVQDDAERCREGGKYVRLTISDNGCGMAPHVLEHAFEPFFTTKGVGKGTGLGLSTVYGIIQQNHGVIQVDSEPGRGTTFVILFPATPEGDEQKEAAETLESLRGSETILVTEDEPGVRKLVRETLETLGYTVLQASNGDEALRILEQYSARVDLLLTDVVMPVMSGRELAKRVKSARPTTKVLYMSGYTDDTLAFHGLPQADTSYLQKPFTAVGLAGKLRHVLADGQR
jgi:PAS domain S-box-containing protein